MQITVCTFFSLRRGGSSMDRFSLETEELAVIDADVRQRQTNKKRKWREIEALKDRYRLQRELQSIDLNYELSINDISLN